MAGEQNKRYFGMTGAQIGVLVVMSLFVCGILGVGVLLVLQSSMPASAGEPNQQPLRPQPTYTLLPTYTPLPTFTALPKYPPTWTPTPKPLTDCEALLSWFDDNKILLGELQELSDEETAFMASSISIKRPPAEIIDPLRKFSTRYLNIATSLRRQDAPAKYSKFIYAWTDALS